MKLNQVCADSAAPALNSSSKVHQQARRKVRAAGVLAGGALALAPLLLSIPALASSHREAPFIAGLPKLDGTDFYMFRSYEPGRSGFVTMIANYIPLQDPYGGPNYFTLDPSGLYEIKIDNTGGAAANLSFQFKFKNTQQNLAVTVGGQSVAVPLADIGQIGRGGDPNDIANLNVRETYTLTLVRNGVSSPITNATTSATEFMKPVDYVGTKTLPNYAAYAAAHIFPINIPGCATPGRVFVGQRKDPFVVNLGETFDLINIANPIGEQFNNSGRDDLADKNVTSLALEVPIPCLMAGDPVIGGWTTSSRIKSTTANGPVYAQYSRLGMPLVNEVVIGLKAKDTFNASLPANDGQFAKFVTNPSFPQLVQIIFAGAGIQAPTLFPRSDLVATFLTGITGINKPANVTPSEMLRLNTNTPVTVAASQNRLGVIGGDSAGFPNGRRPGDDVVDVVLRVAMGRLISLGLFGTPTQAPSGNLDFTDGALVNASFFDTVFPYVKTPLPGSPGPAVPSVPSAAKASASTK